MKKDRIRVIQSFEIIDRKFSGFKQTEKKIANETWKFAITSAKLANQFFIRSFEIMFGIR